MKKQNMLSALLGDGTAFEGKLSFEGVLHIHGEFKGEIFTPDTLVIGPNADVNAQIEAGEVIIAGRMQGNIYAHKQVTLKAPAHFTGTVTSPSLDIQKGVLFEGASYMPDTISSARSTEVSP